MYGGPLFSILNKNLRIQNDQKNPPMFIVGIQRKQVSLV